MWDDFGFGDIDLDAFEFDPTLLMDLAGEGGDLVLDTVTGQLVDASTLDPSEIADASEQAYGPENYDWEGAAAGETGPGQATPEQIKATTPFNATPASSGVPWSKIAQGLAAALKPIGEAGSGLASLAGGGGAGEGLTGSVGGGGMMTAPTYGGGGGGGGLSGMLSAGSMDAPSVGSGGGIPLGGLASLAAPMRAAEQDPIQAALMRLQADAGPRAPMQAPIPMEAPARFTPLSIPPGGGVPMAAQRGPRMSGLQALMQERRG